MRLTINQPYLIPYAGYFRLFNADVHVILDDVQMPHPGYVHRNKLTKHDGSKDWLTIPLLRHPLDTKIKDIEFANNAGDKWRRELGRFKIFKGKSLSHFARTVSMVTSFTSPVEAVLGALRLARQQLGMDCGMIRSSDMNIREELRGQDRVLAICEKLKATEYVNATGGMHLYDRKAFKKRGIDLKFLSPFENKSSILERLEYEDHADVRREIDDATMFME